MKKERMKELQEKFLIDLDKKYFGEQARLTITPPQPLYCEVYVRKYNHEKDTFSKPKLTVKANHSATTIYHASIGDIVTIKYCGGRGLPRWECFAVSILDDDSSYENPRYKRAWDDDPEYNYNELADYAYYREEMIRNI